MLQQSGCRHEITRVEKILQNKDAFRQDHNI